MKETHPELTEAIEKLEQFDRRESVMNPVTDAERCQVASAFEAATAHDGGFRPCPVCNTGVERNYGCLHMKCPNQDCRHNFYIHCGCPWVYGVNDRCPEHGDTQGHGARAPIVPVVPLPPMIEGSRPVQYRIAQQNCLFRQRMSGFISPPDANGRSYLYASNEAPILHLLRLPNLVQRSHGIQFVAEGVGRNVSGNEEPFTVDFWFGQNEEMPSEYDGFFGNNLQVETRMDRLSRAIRRGGADFGRFWGVAGASVGGVAGGAVAGAVGGAVTLGVANAWAVSTFILAPAVFASASVQTTVLLPIVAAGGAVTGTVLGARQATMAAVDAMDPNLQRIDIEPPAIMDA